MNTPTPLSSNPIPDSGFLRSLSGRYLTGEMCANLKLYKYAGCDKSYLYVHVLTPMNTFLAQFIPLWIAPNLITLLSLILVSIAYIVVYFHNPNFEAIELPSWIYVYVALTLFCYQTLDNLDGRQARRTGSSSPLGLLFDHGVDAINCTIASITGGACFGYNTNAMFVMWSCAYVPFVFATWEEYFTGQLILPEFNGPSDGMFFIMNFLVLSAFFPGIYFQSLGDLISPLQGTIVGSMLVNKIPLVLGTVGVLITIWGNVNEVAKQHNIWRPLSKLSPFALLYFIGFTWAYYSPSNIMHSQPRVFFCNLGFLFGNMICKMMIAHICHVDYKIYRTVLLPLILCWCNVMLSHVGLVSPLSERTTLFISCACSVSIWFHFVYNVIDEITELLNIRCFVLTKKPEDTSSSINSNGSTPPSSSPNSNVFHRKLSKP